MAKRKNKRLLWFASAFTLANILCLNTPFAEEVPVVETDDFLAAKVATLEKTVAQLRQQIQNDKMASSLSGYYWVEQSRILAGEREAQIDEVAWRLSTDVSSNRYILAPEVSTYEYGPLSIDTSRNPAWIDFEIQRFGKSHTVKGIVRTSYGRCEIAIPGKLFDRNTFLNPPRPTSFESTADNGYDVYSLVRERFKRTGVWQ